METKEMKALNCLLSIIDCYMKEDEKYGIFPEDTIKKDVDEAKTILETFIKKEYISPDYIEAFENIIFQKRDNGYISDAYRNDISVVYEALYKLENKGEETMKDYSTKYGSNATVESFSETQKVGETYKIFVGDEIVKNNNNELLLQEQQNKATEIIFNKCRDNVNLLLVNRNDTYDDYNSAFEYQMRTNVFDLKEEDKLTIDEFIDIFEWLESERVKNGLETAVDYKAVEAVDTHFCKFQI